MRNQHRQLGVLRERINAELARSSIAGARREFELLAESLHAHFRVEERFVFSAIRGLGPSAAQLIDELMDEHRALTGQLSALHDELAGGNGFAFAVRLEALMKALASHEEREEGVVGQAGGHGDGEPDGDGRSGTRSEPSQGTLRQPAGAARSSWLSR